MRQRVTILPHNPEIYRPLKMGGLYKIYTKIQLLRLVYTMADFKSNKYKIVLFGF